MSVFLRQRDSNPNTFSQKPIFGKHYRPSIFTTILCHSSVRSWTLLPWGHFSWTLRMSGFSDVLNCLDFMPGLCPFNWLWLQKCQLEVCNFKNCQGLLRGLVPFLLLISFFAQKCYLDFLQTTAKWCYITSILFCILHQLSLICQRITLSSSPLEFSYPVVFMTGP